MDLRRRRRLSVSDERRIPQTKGINKEMKKQVNWEWVITLLCIVILCFCACRQATTILPSTSRFRNNHDALPTVMLSRRRNKTRLVRPPQASNLPKEQKWYTIEAMRVVLEANYTLISLDVPRNALESYREGGGDMVTGTFCQVDWSLQKENPASVPMFKHLVKQSAACHSRVQVGFQQLVKFAKETRIPSTSPTGYVIHESRCGSTLVSNMLASFSRATVYSEHPAPTAVLHACSIAQHCNKTKTESLLKDVFFVLGLKRPSHVFYKFPSMTWIEEFLALNDTIPWIFLYRDPIEVMVSQLSRRPSHCLRQQRTPPVSLLELVRSMGFNETKSLTKEEFCAAYLADLCRAAVEASQSSHMGRFVQYNALPEAVWEWVIPNHFGVPVHEKDIDVMKQVAMLYSKGGDSEWQNDSTDKQNKANELIIAAVNLFLRDIHKTMGTLTTKPTNQD